jgi:hypothetical protein
MTSGQLAGFKFDCIELLFVYFALRFVLRLGEQAIGAGRSVGPSIVTKQVRFS